MKQHSRLSAKQEQEQENQAQSHQEQKSGIEFNTPEEMLRHDAAKVVVPPRVSDKLRNSIRDIPAPRPTPWWKKLIGG